MHNERACKMIEERFSNQVRLFNHCDVSEADSDTHYWTVKERAELARVALERAPQMTVATLPRSLGNIYVAIRRHLHADELDRWTKSNDVLEELMDKYGM
ncbi:hypothetical protein [Streptomyces sp. 769]|uniref:hypothetical protein n=1 Tax=Streptomyces sp. 769 TaxID=1262452 RepID=UPI00131B6AE9|nr:hypothetical protein [Streptomyces sp. 769]